MSNDKKNGFKRPDVGEIVKCGMETSHSKRGNKI